MKRVLKEAAKAVGLYLLTNKRAHAALIVLAVGAWEAVKAAVA